MSISLSKSEFLTKGRSTRATHDIPQLTLIRTRVSAIWQPLEEIHEFEGAIERQTNWAVVNGPSRIPVLILFKIVARVINLIGLVIDRILRSTRFASSRKFLSVGYVAPHYLGYKTFPYFAIPAALRAVWVYDAWENKLAEIGSAFRRHHVNVAFVSSKQAANHFNSLGLERFEAHWLPEAITVSDYRSKPVAKRNIDVLQLCRRWDKYHEKIHDYCLRNDIQYVFEKTKGRIIFPTREGFLEGLANSKISICVPSAVTHPERSGTISTMTWRYLQSMASKCLVLGLMPEEMHGLFDYDPIIKIDLEHPCEQLKSILAHFDDYSDLIERNYRYVSENHEWINRIRIVERIIEEALIRQKCRVPL